MLVGRESELSLLAERIAAQRAAAVLGEAGVGKTVLVRSAAEQAGKRLFEAGALATLSWLPYLPLRRAFGRDFADGDAAYVASEIEGQLGDGLLFFDDFHWADAQTRTLLPLLAGRVPVIAAIRRGDPATAAALEATASAGLELVPLEPLGAGDAAELARLLYPQLSQAATERLVTRSGGNPFLLEQLAASGEPSESLRLAVSARLRLLTPSGREAIGLLALLGRPAARDVLGAGSAELVAAGLASGNGELAIRHALIGDATIEELEPQDRRRLHSRLAAALTDPGESARHHAAAGERAPAREKALLAAQRATTPGERVAHLAVAAANADGVEAEPLRVASARELLGVGEPAEALELIAELDSSNMEVAAEAALLRSQAHLDLIRLDDARRELAAAAAAGTDDARLRVRIAMQTAALAARQGDYRATVEHAEEGIGIADSSAVEGREVADLYLWLGAARRHLGVPGARAAQERAVEIARRVGATELEFKAIRFLSFGLLLEGEAATAARISREAAERARSLRLLAWERDFQGWHAGYTWHLGEPALAASEAEAVLAEPISPELRESFEFYWWQAMADLGRGDEVRPFAEARVANAPEDNDGVGDTLWVLADIELAAGRPDVAERHAASYLDRFGRASTFVGVLRAWAQFEQGVLPAPAPGSQLPLVEAGPIEVDALVELFRGDAAAAAGGFDRAAALWQGRHVRGDIRCRWAAADALRCAGKIDEAKARLLLLEPEAERRQLNVLLRKIRRSLRLIGVPRAAARTSDGLLTGREREVLAFVAGGLTNDEIARRLGLGRPTVVRLIRSAQQKLGATSRTQAAALAARR